VDVGCLGKIIQHERLADGRFNLLLLGCCRVKLVREVPTDKLYRIAEAEVMEDHDSDRPSEPRRQDLISLFRELLRRKDRLNDDLSAFLDTEVPLGILSDIIAHAVLIPSGIKQELLAQTDVDVRVEALLAILPKLLASGTSHRRFPPAFSSN
jgi:uncharacterized protein